MYNGHDEFIKACVDEFNANLLVCNNGEQGILGVLNEGRLAMVPDDDWTVESATAKAREAMTDRARAASSETPVDPNPCPRASA